jgi:hypothetical protein
MALCFHPSIVPAAVILLASSGCAAHALPAGDGANPALQLSSVASDSRPADRTSILKKLTKDVVIGSTVDAKNGDKGPRTVYIVRGSAVGGVLTKGQLLVCNFEDSAGVSGKGTTMEALNPTPNAAPKRFFQSDVIEGCDGDAILDNGSNDVYGAGLTSGKIAGISRTGVLFKTYSGKTVTAPFSDTAAVLPQPFSPLYVYAGTTTGGGILSISVGSYGDGLATQVAKGFGVSDGPGGKLAPSGLQYDVSTDTLYIVDGVTNTIVAFSNSSKLLDKDEIIVKSGGKTFKCKYPKTACARLVYSGSPLHAPMASALLPNGNLVVANTEGTANMLVELTPSGRVLDTKVVDHKSKQGVFGLAAAGTKSSNTVLLYTDTNSNTVQELRRPRS